MPRDDDGPVAPAVALRPAVPADLVLIEGWLAAPHVARWWLLSSTTEAEMAAVRGSVRGERGVQVLLVLAAGVPIGWCQWYRCEDYPEHAAGVGAHPGEVGIDYAIGSAAHIGRGFGTALVAELVRHVRAQQPRCGVIVDPDARNVASRRVLEKNGFTLVDVRPVASEPTDDPVAIYRLTPSVN